MSEIEEAKLIKAEAHSEEYTKLLDFLIKSTQYRPRRLLSKLKDNGECFHPVSYGSDNFSEMPEARAILFGRIGKHEEALLIYVYRLQDYSAAEA